MSPTEMEQLEGESIRREGDAELLGGAPPALQPASGAASPLKTVAIVGAGFSGTMAAVHLLRARPAGGLRIVLIEPAAAPGRGLAYGTSDDVHVLNVPAAGMSALPDDPDSFVRHRQALAPATQDTDFIARRHYGPYLAALLDEARRHAGRGSVLQHVEARVIGLTLTRDRPGAQVRLSKGGTLWADQVVLAIGHAAPVDPPGVSEAVRASGRYVGDPWATGALQSLQPEDHVALLGTGLTALDVVMSLRARGHTGAIWCLSRRGLSPQPHRAHGQPAAWPDLEALLPALHAGPRAALRALRSAAATADARQLDWRDLIGAIRKHIPAIWQAWPVSARRRFLRHLQAHWDTHRHRCAPAAGQAWADLVRTGRLQLQAGRLSGATVSPRGLDLQWRARGGDSIRARHVDHLINCTGPGSRLADARSPLIDDLLRQGLIAPDALGLGLRVDDHYAVLSASGHAQPALRYIGPWLRAHHWEATAVPELRQHAQGVAQAVLTALARA